MYLTIATTFNENAKNTYGIKAALHNWISYTCVDKIFIYGVQNATWKKLSEKICLYPSPGFPFVSQILSTVQREIKSNYYGYVNSDIIFKGNIEKIIIDTDKHANRGKILITGLRTNIEASEIKMINNCNVGEISHGGLDYFFFKKGDFLKFPDLYIGKVYWDFKFIEIAKKNNIKIYNATKVLEAFHINHTSRDYGRHYQAMYKNPKVLYNKMKSPWWITIWYGLEHSDYVFCVDGLIHKAPKTNEIKKIYEYVVGIIYHLILPSSAVTHSLLFLIGNIYRKTNNFLANRKT
jgi:hypothetical protein